ncbi:MAG: NfeD family protein [Chloroherpetonaceae bacterium]
MEAIQSFFANPDIAYLLLILGFLGILFEAATPGVTFPGAVGTVSLLLSIYSMSLLPVNVTGLVLITIGFILFILEVKVTSFGILTFFGLLFYIFGSIYLFDSGVNMNVSPALIVASSLILAAFTIFLLYLGLKAQRNRKASGTNALIGRQGIALQDMFPNTQSEVKIMGEHWRAISNEFIKEGETVIVKNIKDLTLIVEKIH